MSLQTVGRGNEKIRTRHGKEHHPFNFMYFFLKNMQNEHKCILNTDSRQNNFRFTSIIIMNTEIIKNRRISRTTLFLECLHFFVLIPILYSHIFILVCTNSHKPFCL